ncbi:NDR1/HIN1-like protein 13 [Neltuma alba]|uniref:NDR1/HIN1-like protein 13 n=1 Tax=Neltuma alba TaxID=207710 RepID=UPI0010A3A531|nr:NDR1/HIN1-like protein 13 [Prosopis alba]
MAKRVLPHADAKTASPPHSKPTPRPGTHIVKVPRDQIYRAPHPENARLFQSYTSRKSHRSRCCCRLAFIFVFIFPLAIAAGVLYLVFHPKPPEYTVQGVAIKGMDLTSPSSEVARISPGFDVRIRANNPNDKMGIYYEKGGSVEVFYKDVTVCSGAWTAFYQPPKNVTVVETSLKGSNGVVREHRWKLVGVCVEVKVGVAVKLKVGGFIEDVGNEG